MNEPNFRRWIGLAAVVGLGCLLAPNAALSDSAGEEPLNRVAQGLESLLHQSQTRRRDIRHSDEAQRGSDLETRKALTKVLDKSLTQRIDSVCQEDGCVEIVLLHTNDIHGHIDHTEAEGRHHATDGAAVIATYLAKTPHDLWIDSGDWWENTAIGGLTAVKGSAVMETFNKLGLDVTELGNHEFDAGVKGLEDLLALKNSHLKVLCANIFPPLPGVDPYAMKEIHKDFHGQDIAIKLGILGLLTPDMPRLALPEDIEGETFAEIGAVANDNIAKMKAEGADVLVATTHLGLEHTNTKKYDGIAQGDYYLAEHAPALDVILGGHTHTHLEHMLNWYDFNNGAHQTGITQTQGMAAAIYKVTIFFDVKTRRVVGTQSEIVDLDPKIFPADENVLAFVDNLEKPVIQIMNEPVGSSAGELSKGGEESTLGDWVSDVLRESAHADVGIVNRGGLRTSLPSGQILFRHVFGIMPFDNRLASVKVTGDDLKRILENSFSKDGTSLQFSGVEIVYDKLSADGAHIKSLKVGGVPMRPEQIYTVGTMDFIVLADRAFKDRVTKKPMSYTDLKIYSGDKYLVRNLMIADIQRRPNKTVSVKIDGRIKQLSQ